MNEMVVFLSRKKSDFLPEKMIGMYSGFLGDDDGNEGDTDNWNVCVFNRSIDEYKPKMVSILKYKWRGCYEKSVGKWYWKK